METTGSDIPTFAVLSRYRGVLMGVQTILIMAFHHAEDLSNDDRLHGVWRLVYKYIGSSGVDVFLLLSGLGLYFSWMKNPDRNRFYSRRFVRVLVPYAMVALIGWSWLDLWHDRTGLGTFVEDITFLSFFLHGDRWFWYILVSLACYALFPYVFAAIHSARDHVEEWFRTLYMCGMGVFTVVLLEQYANDLYANVSIMLNRIPMFILGCLVGRMAYERRALSVRAVSVGFLLTAFLLYPLQMVDARILHVYLSALFNLFSCLVVVLALGALSARGGTSVRRIHDALCRVLSWFGRYSLELYLLHVMIRKMLILHGLSTAMPRNEVLLVALSLALAVPFKRLAALIQKPLLERYVSLPA